MTLLKYFLILGMICIGFNSYAELPPPPIRPDPRPLGKTFESYLTPLETETLLSSSMENPSGILTLSQALSLSLLHNPELTSEAWKIQGASGQAQQAGLLPNPELESDFETPAGQTSIQLSQLIELGSKRSYRKQVALLEQELVGWHYESKRLDVVTKVKQAFVEVLVSQQRLKFAEEIRHQAREVLDTVSERVNSGKDSPIVQTQARIMWMNSRIQWKHAGRDLNNARNSLSTLWGSESANFERAEGQLEQIFPVPALDQLFPKLSQNSDMLRWQVEEARSKASLRLAESMKIPDLTISGGIQYEAAVDDEFGVLLGIALPLPVFDRNQGEILETQANLAGIRQERHAAETQIRVDLVNAYQALATAFEEASTLKTAILPDAQKGFDAVKEGYLFGKFDYLELLNAQRTLLEVKQQYIDALAEYHNAKAEVERLIAEPIHSR